MRLLHTADWHIGKRLYGVDRMAESAAVFAEIRGHPRRLDLTASRRLALRARKGGVMGLLLRHAAVSEPGAETTRWPRTGRFEAS